MKQGRSRQVAQSSIDAVFCALSSLRWVPVFLFVAASMPVHSAVSDEACLQEFKPIVERLDVAAMARAFNNRPDNDACSRSMRDEVHLDFTNDVAKRARQILSESNSPERAADWLNQFSSVELSLPLAKSWQVNFVRGEIASAAGEKREAAEQFDIAYRHSLGSSASVNQAIRPASDEEQEFLYLRASEARHLYGDLSDAISRSGESTAATMGTRGVVQRRASPLPIEFESDSAVIESTGIDNVTLIVAYIKRQNITEFEVIGHTDWHGTREYNLDLSLRRANAVADEIQNQYHEIDGGSLRIEVRGRGEDCPRIISQIDQYSADDAAALYRRVSLGWSGQSASTLSECDQNGIKSDG